MIQAAEIASALMHEHDARRPFHSIRDAFPLEGLDASYDVQDRFVDLLRQRHRCGLAGYKVGLTSPRMQAMCGIAHPVAGAVLSNRVFASGATVRASDFVHLGVECEIAVLIGRDLDRDLPETIAALGGAVAGVAPAFEIVDDRRADYRALDVPTLITDNAWNAGVVLGAFAQTWPDLAEVEGVLTVNGTAVERGLGGHVMGHPFEPLLWLARHLAGRRSALRRGEIVMTGSLVPTVFPGPGDALRFSLGALGAVELAVAPNGV
ncbi:MAG TPA: fumarylacetoacetate hydrolase family protein [Microvirga sp.]|nr:fumarylacetoacetate hydrolase family protein [Microvirga sp.]